MKALLLALVVGVVSLSFAPTQADARRLGGGAAAGMQRSLPPRTPPAALPAQPAAPVAAPATAGATAAAAAAAPRRSWMGPIAGLAAGLGIAALMSHLGFGAEFGNIIMMVLIGLVAIVAVRWALRRFAPTASAPAGGMQYAGNAGSGAGWQREPTAGFGSGPAAPAAAALPAATSQANPALPAGFDRAGFERIAKMIFIRLQAANDAGDLTDLRTFTTPEMFSSVKMDLQDRGSAKQQTDVVKIDAEVLDVASEADRQVVSVRFHGLIREELDGVAAPFDEVWHLVRPIDGSREWAIAGIQQMA